MKKVAFSVVLLALALSASEASAGIIRHVVKPVVTHTAKATAKVVKTAAHVAKRVAY